MSGYLVLSMLHTNAAPFAVTRLIDLFSQRYLVVSFFFFSSRRRHTRSLRDWSSDVCSSDLAHPALGDARSEWVLQVRGTVRPRPEGTKNPKLSTGEIEIVANSVTILNQSKTPPFYVNEDTEIEETLRWKYRYVDLRRERSRELMRLRHEVTNFMRNFFVERGFWELETTMMIRSDPTGARDVVVPSRYFPGKFSALP